MDQLEQQKKDQYYSDFYIALFKAIILVLGVLMFMWGIINTESDDIIIKIFSLMSIIFGLYFSSIIIYISLQGV